MDCKCGDSYTLGKRSKHYQSKAHRDWLSRLTVDTKRQTIKEILEQHTNPDIVERILDLLS